MRYLLLLADLLIFSIHRSGFGSTCSNALELWDPVTNAMVSSTLGSFQLESLMVSSYGTKIFLGGMISIRGLLCSEID